MKKIFLLSESFNYSRMITHDAGVGYAQRMGWEQAKLKDWQQYSDRLIIIDNRITEAECEWVENLILQQRDTPFMLRVIDPYLANRDHPYYRLLFQVKERPNVRYLSPYQPTELVAELRDVVGDRMVILPYPFVAEDNVDTGMRERRRQMIFSGARHPHIYPERQVLIDTVRRNPLLWGKVHHLKHPGYPDIGQTQRHSIIGQQYVTYLSRFRWMFLSPSRCRLEFLKYSECANARCVPVGQAPDSFSDRLRSCFIDLDFDRLHHSIRRLFSRPLDELEAIASEYRLAMAEERNPARLNAQLDEYSASR